jgi:hypothetical protein
MESLNAKTTPIFPEEKVFEIADLVKIYAEFATRS